ncbi:tRNA-dependent cyclodipeptide synthase [Streptomyces sp. NPDC001941]|uniref:tRNA-dependent cyclodipeptide synthase n=1 Tax=Streptomyces sp. NPDC001941 TaxID=3154659 RepID=UPI003322E0FA
MTPSPGSPGSATSPGTVTSSGTFIVEPFTRACRIVREDADHVLIGVSPGNSYFNARRVEELARWAAARFTAVDFVYADLHVAALFEALGHPPEHAARRAAKELKAVRRRVLGGVEAAGPPGARVRVHALSDFADHPVYRLLHRRVRHFLETDDEFRKGCDAMVEHFLAGKAGPGGVTGAQRAACLDYVAAELPFFLDTPGILGVPSSLACYHRPIPLTELLYAKGGGLRAARNQAYALVRPAEAAA